MNAQKPLHVSVLGAGSSYGIFLVKWAYQLLRDPKSNREDLAIPPIGSISYSNTSERNRNLVFEVLQDDLHQMPGFENTTAEELKKHIRGYDRWREMVTEEKPDLLVVCSPTETHVPIVRELVTDFGVKNILCENPLAPLNESDSLPGLQDLLKEHGVTMGVNQQYAALEAHLRDVPLRPDDPTAPRFRSLTDGLTGADVTFITHGTRPWRQFGNIGEKEILEDLGTHALYFLPAAIRHQPVKVQRVHREGDNLVLNLVEYDLLFGSLPVRIALGYRRKLKSLKVVFRRNKQTYEFHITGGTSSQTGEYTRVIEGKDYAYPFRYGLRTDLVKYSFMKSLLRQPLVPLEEAVINQNTIRNILEGSSHLR